MLALTAMAVASLVALSFGVARLVYLARTAGHPITRIGRAYALERVGPDSPTEPMAPDSPTGAQRGPNRTAA